jgi:protein-tyrosine phosphatase
MGKKNRKRNRQRDKKVKRWKQVKRFLPCHSGTMEVFKDPKSDVRIHGGGYLRELSIYFGHLIIDVGADIEVENINIKNASYPELEAYNNPIVQIDWEDFGAVSLPIDFWKTLVKLIRKEKRDVTVCCQGGHGRTGTVLSILAYFMGVEKKNPVKYVRDNYCYKAVESYDQLKYVAYVTDTDRKEHIPNDAFVWDWEQVDEDQQTHEHDHDNNPLTEGESATSGQAELDAWLEERGENYHTETGVSNKPYDYSNWGSGLPKDVVPKKDFNNIHKSPIFADEDLTEEEEEIDTPLAYNDGKLVNTHIKNGVLVIEAGQELKAKIAEEERSDNPLENLRDIDKEELMNHYKTKEM